MGNSDSKTIFRDQVQKLLNEEIGFEDTNFWDVLFSLPTSEEDVFAMIPSSDIEHMLQNHPQNLHNLIRYCFDLITESTHQIYELTASRITATQNAVRLLTKIIPCTFEHQEFWWEENLAYKLILGVMSLMFTPGYSVVASLKRKEIEKFNQVEVGLLWKPGVFCDYNLASASKEIVTRRCELLRLLLSMMTEGMRWKMSVYARKVSSWRWILCSQANPYLYQLFYTMLNTLISYNAKGYLGIPYSNYVSSEETNTHLALQVLIVLLEFRPPSPEEVEDMEEYDLITAKDIILENQSTEDALYKNEFTAIVQQTDSLEFLEKTYKGLFQLLYNRVVAENTYLPYSQKDINFNEELVILFWNLLCSNKEFLNYVSQQSDICKVVLALYYLLEDYKSSLTYFGVVGVITNIFLTLSETRDFSVSLNQNFDENTPQKLPLFGPKYSDMIYTYFSQLILYEEEAFKNYQQNLLIFMSNISHFTKSVSKTSSHLLICLFEKFSLRSYLLGAPNNHYSIFYLFEVFNNLIQYSWNGSSFLLLNIVKKRHLFYKLLELCKPIQVEEEKKEPSSNPIIGLTPENVHEKVIYASILNSQVSVNSDDHVEVTETLQHIPEEEEWAPTQNWIQSWSRFLPIKLCILVIENLLQPIENYTLDNPQATDHQIANFVKEQTLVGILPAPHKVMLRKMQPMTPEEKARVSVVVWSVLFMKQSSLQIIHPGELLSQV
mgnify:CR=1 FL=1